MTVYILSIPIYFVLDKPISNLKTPVDSSVNEVYFRHNIYPNLSSLDFYIYIYIYKYTYNYFFAFTIVALAKKRALAYKSKF